MNLQLRWDLFHALSSEAQHLDTIKPYPALVRAEVPASRSEAVKSG